jgi:hypothetical protein
MAGRANGANDIHPTKSAISSRNCELQLKEYLPGAFSGAAFGYGLARELAGVGLGRQSALRVR